jgi:hypothetical protein
MGFYAPAQLVRDAREHGVEVRPVDVAVSAWESTLEGDVGTAPAKSAGARGEGASLRQPLRLGLNRVKGLAEDAGERIVAARGDARFADSEDLARRARLDAHALAALAEAVRCRASPVIATRRRGRSPASTRGRPKCCARRVRTSRALPSPRRAKGRRRWPTTASSA